MKVTLAATYLWWKPPEEALLNPPEILRQILRMADQADYCAACDLWGEGAIKDALITSPPGAIDHRSWVFWHLNYGLEGRPTPIRTFLDAQFKSPRLTRYPDYNDVEDSESWMYGRPAIERLAAKLYAVQDRPQPHDFAAIEILLRGGLTLNDGVSALVARYGHEVNGLSAAKALAFFEDGLEHILSIGTQRYLEHVISTFNPRLHSGHK